MSEHNHLPSSATMLAYAFIAIMVTINLILVAASLWITMDQITPSSQFVDPVSTPDKSSYCPGDTMRFPARWKVNKNGIMEIYESWWSVAETRTVIFDDAPKFVVNTGSGYREGHLSVVIPVLPPGQYQYKRGALNSQSDVSTIVVPFTIGDDCIGLQK